MLDMSSMAGLTQAQAISLIASLNSQPSVARIPDGRMLIAAFNASSTAILLVGDHRAAKHPECECRASYPVLLRQPHHFTALEHQHWHRRVGDGYPIGCARAGELLAAGTHTAI